jgi:uncharacterized membrane protein
MFRGLINDAKSAAGSLIAKYLARASVAVPFVIALGFATAAITLMLVERFGAIAGYWVAAGGFTAIGLVATLAVSVKEQEKESVEKQAKESDTSAVASDAAAQAAAQAPLALLGALFSTPMGPGAVAGGARILAQNVPLVVFLGLVALLFWPSEPTSKPTDTDGPDLRARPNGAHPPIPEGLYGPAP